MMGYFKTGAAALLFCVWIIPTPSFQQPTQFETIYDAQKDLTTTRLPFSRLSGEKDRYYSVDFSVFFTYQGKTKPVPESVNFELISVVKARKLNSDLYVVFVADGEQLHFGSDRSAIPKPVKGRTWVGERMIFTIPLEKFERLVAAKDLAIKMGATLFPLSAEARDSLRAFAKECRS